jgi:hypothetical protein
MKKQIPHIKIPHIIALAAITGLLVSAVNTTQAQSTDPLLADPVDQSAFPQITAQPVDQLVPVGSNVTLTVQADNADGYQWLSNGIAIDGQTSNSLTVENVKVSDAGFYSCAVFNDIEVVPTRAANVSIVAGKGVITAKPVIGANMSGGGPITVFSAPIASGGTQGTCPGTYAGYTIYTKTFSQGWGWAPATNTTTTFTAADGGGRTDTTIVYLGMNYDSGCNPTSVTIPNPPISAAYRFAIYFKNSVPTTNYPIVLTGLN